MGRNLSRSGLAATAAGIVLLGAAVITGPAAASPGQSVSDLTTLTANDLAANLTGGGLSVSGVTYTGVPFAAGTFTGMDAVGFGSGVVLSTGEAKTIVGPNNADGTSGEFGAPGDADVSALIGGEETNDASVLEFDFVPTTDSVTFRYVFGSEEYNEYVGEFNDGFVFLVNDTNCAKIGDSPVSVNSINTTSNPGFYRNNDPSDGPPTIDVQADGLTTVLTCSAPVTADATNHIKLAIADAIDDALDSTVYIEAGSLQANLPPLAVADAYAVTPNVPLSVPVPGVLANDSDPNGDAITAIKVDDPAHGTVSFNSDGSFVYTPATDYVGTDLFTYKATDGTLESGVVGVTLTVSNPPPTVTVTIPDTTTTTSTTTTEPETTTTTEPETTVSEPETTVAEPATTVGGGTSGESGGSGLARTGSDSLPLALAGAGLIALGLSLLAVRSRLGAARR